MKEYLKKQWLEAKKALKLALIDLGRSLKGEQLWQEIHVSPGIRPEETMRRFAFLRARGVRCRLINLGSAGIRGINVGSVVLRVHKDDVPKAFSLLKDLPK
ncbi:MAG: hypothetical protein JW712_01875 [Dehalococcoidales bacterium]|nr:hypothetical protein [Dehalococcoidales bacterium]